MDQLDLDINNYNINDLERFFQINPRAKYSEGDIELKEYNIREKLLASGHIDKRFKRDLIEFLELAKNWLIFVKCRKGDLAKPTTIPDNYKLDTMDTPISKEVEPRTNELINREETQFVHSSNSDFFPGKLNQLNTRILTKSLNIDTRFRDNLYSTQSSDFSIQMPIKFNKVVSMSLSSLELPVSFYGICKEFGNNFLYLRVCHNAFDSSDNMITIERVITIPDGNYNASDLIDTINKLLSPRNTDASLVNPNDIFSYIELTHDITVSGSGTGKVTISPTGTYSDLIKTIILDFTKDCNGNVDKVDVSTKFGWNLGFIKKKYIGSTSYTADTVIEPANIRYIYLAVDDFANSANNQFVNVFNNSIMSPNILARISIKGSYFSLIMENDFNIITEPRRYFGPVDIQRLRIRLFDERGRVLPMNNSNFSFCLDFKLIYDL
tara:strand:- start:999 stop:2312 length:1314 start_codon:yes stop_codon:yes gene_type:complete